MESFNCADWNAFELKCHSLASKVAARRSRPIKPTYRRHPKPPYIYNGLIVTAIQSSENKKLTLSDIHEALGRMFPFFRDARYTGWKDSVRHNLSSHSCFQMELKDPARKNGKNNFWKVDMSKVNADMFRKQQTSVAREGNWALDLHQQLGTPPIVCKEAPKLSTLSLPQSIAQRLTSSRKRKFEEDTSMNCVTTEAPAAKRHQSFNIANILSVSQPEPCEDVKPLNSWTVPEATSSSPWQQTSAQCSVYDFGCYDPGATAHTSAYPQCLDLYLRDFLCPSFDGLPAFDDVTDLVTDSAVVPMTSFYSSSRTASTLELPACSMTPRTQFLSNCTTSSLPAAEEVPSDYTQFPVDVQLKSIYVPGVSGYCSSYPFFSEV